MSEFKVIPYNNKIRAEIRAELAVPGVKCYLCKRAIDINLPKGLPGSFELEDLHARANGGDPNDRDNLLPSHKSCNLGKGTMPADDAIRTIKSKSQTSRQW